MRVKWTVVSTGMLMAGALATPFVLPIALNGHGSAVAVHEAAAPPAASNGVVQMAPLPAHRPFRIVGTPAAHAAEIVTTQRGVSLAAYRPAPVRAGSAASSTVEKQVAAVVRVRTHRPAPVDPPAAAPLVRVTASVAPVTTPAAAPAPAPAAVSLNDTQAPTTPAPQATPANAQPSDGSGTDQTNGHGHGHGHDGGHTKHGHDDSGN